MWKVLGVETAVVKAGDVWANRMIELSARKKDADKFRELFSKADLRYYFDTIREVHMFYLQFPRKVKVEDLEFVRDFILKLEKAAKAPVIEYDGEAQKYSVVLSSDTETDLYEKWRKQDE